MDSSENSRLKDTGQPSSSKTPANKARISQRNLFKHLHIHLDGPISSFNANQLPTAKHIIERYLWCTSSSDKKNIKKSDFVGCQVKPDKNLTCHGAKCEGKAVQPETNKCIVREVIEQWNKGGYYEDVLISEYSIKLRVVKLLDDYTALKKHNNKKTQEFMTNLRKLFQIQKPNYKEIINEDKMRCELSKIEDIKFIEKLIAGENLVMIGKDKAFAMRVEKAQKRMESFFEKLTVEEERAKKEKIRQERESVKYTLESSSESNEFIPNDKDFEINVYQQRKEEGLERKRNNSGKLKSSTKVCLYLSVDDVVSSWTPFITRFGIGNQAETSLLSQIFKIGGMDVSTDQLPISQTSIFNRNSAMVQLNGQEYRDELVNKCSQLKLVVHFDSKIMEQYRVESKLVTKTDRLAISVSSPDDAEIDFLLGCVEIESSKGSDQALTIQSMLEYFELTENVVGFVSDTTASNSGRVRGAVRLMAVFAFTKAMLNLMCRLHQYERHISHVDNSLQGKTSAPTRAVFAKFKSEWSEDIMKAVNDDNANIIKLDWSRPEFCPGTILYQLLTESLEFCLNALKQDIWQSGRSDHKYLCQLVVVFLGGQVPGKFRFHQPQACHQARWFACAIYFLVITMTGNYYKLEPDVKKQMEVGAEYVAFFHAKFFLQASLPAVAPANDLRAIKIAITLKNDKELDRRYGGLAQALLDSTRRHTWYLVPQLIGLSLADEDLEVESRHAILNKILQFDVPESDEFDKEISTPIVEPDINTKLEDLVNQESYLLFEALGFKAENLKQLQESNFDSASPIYHQFREKVKNLSVTNVTAERNIRLISDFILKNHKEDKLQDCLQVVKKNRKDYPKNMTKKSFK